MKLPSFVLVSFAVALVACAAIFSTVGAEPVPVPCVRENCAFSTNIPYDSVGDPDSRPFTWGDASYNDAYVPFANVPPGYRVRLYRVYGDFIAWAHGRVIPGTNAGALFGILDTTPWQSPYVAAGLGSMGCSVYLQEGVGAEPVRAPFDFDIRVGGLLGPDNVMLVRRAVFLNDTGVSIHEEATMVVEFRYEAER